MHANYNFFFKWGLNQVEISSTVPLSTIILTVRIYFYRIFLVLIYFMIKYECIILGSWI